MARGPVKYTCPDIDKAIKKIRSALDIAHLAKRPLEKDDDSYRDFEAIEDELWSIEDVFEELRSSNQALREWGEELEKERDELLTQID